MLLAAKTEYYLSSLISDTELQDSEFSLLVFLVQDFLSMPIFLSFQVARYILCHWTLDTRNLPFDFTGVYNEEIALNPRETLGF